ncbi:MAG: DUF4203 domain-containing protein, partial [Opitutales bacterium]
METVPPAQDPYTIGVYVAIIVTGLVNCFFGFRIFRYALAVILALAGAGAAAWAGAQLELASDRMLWVGIGLGALLGLILSFVFVKAAAAMAGVLLGYTLLLPNIGELSPLLQLVALAVACGIGALLGVLLANPTIKVATAFIGAFQVVYGSLFFIDGTQILILGEDPAAGWRILAARQVPMIATAALGALGVLVQFRRGGRR